MSAEKTLIGVVERALYAFKGFTNDGDVQMQTVSLFFQAVIHEGSPVDYAGLGKLVGITQPAVSRNIKKLASRTSDNDTHYDLIRVEVDYQDARRRIIHLSPRGQELVKRIEAAMLPGLMQYVTQEGVKV